jgi:hypothetical protein
LSKSKQKDQEPRFRETRDLTSTNKRPRIRKKQPAPFCRRAGYINPGNNLLSRWKHYHRPRMLNGRVRNGNGCGHPSVLTGKSHAPPIREARYSKWERQKSSARPLEHRSILSGTDWKSVLPNRAGPRINAVKRLAVSTGQLRPLRALHTRPIYLVVFQEPSFKKNRRPRLAGGFTLRCLQRLSGPYVATQRCPERDNWNTRGTSLPILSY